MAREPSGSETSRRGGKSAEAFRTISEVAGEIDIPQHVLRFWESKFNQIKPLKRGGGRRYYRPEDVELLRRIKSLLYDDGYTIKGVQKLLREGGAKSLDDGPAAAPTGDNNAELKAILEELMAVSDSLKASP
jgi:DNA-binding transcriptional MerR regulator